MGAEFTVSKDRWNFSASVATRLFNSQDAIVLVSKKDSNLWGLPAGGIEKGENVKQAAFREIREELGSYGNIDYLSQAIERSSKSLVIVSPGEIKTSVGIVIDANIEIAFWPTIHSFSPPEFRAMSVKKVVDSLDDEISGAAFFSPQGIASILAYYDRFIFKPEFNKVAMIDWLVRWQNKRLRQSKYNDDQAGVKRTLLLAAEKGKIDGLDLQGEYLTYHPQNVLI